MRRIHADLALIACAAVWGLAFLFQKSAMAHVGPLVFIAARSLVAVLALAPVAVAEQRRAGTGLPPAFLAEAAVAGAAFFAGALLQQIGLKTATVTNASFLTALYVVITPFIAWTLMRRRPGGLVWIAVVLSFAGTWLLGGGGVGAFSAGDTLVALSALFWATHVVLLGRAVRHQRPVLLTTVQFAAVGLMGLAGAAAFESVTLEGLRRAAVDIAYVGLLSSALTFTVFTMALRHASPSEAAIIVSTETVFAALGGYLVLGERLTVVGALGAMLILSAVVLVQTGAAVTEERGRALRGQDRSRQSASMPP